MKKVLVGIIIGFTVASIAYGGLVEVTINYKVAKKLNDLRLMATQQAQNLNTLKTELQEYATTAELDSADKAKFPALKTLVETSITDLEAVRDYVEAQWTDLDME